MVHEGAWELYGYAIHHFGVRPGLIEWDNNIPPLATLLQQAQRADEIVADMTAVEAASAQAC
jgi:uncharacterized protein (UPF0276 family)